MTSWQGVKRPPIRIQNDAVICAIALHEEPYIDEWIQYHLFLGFNHIYIFDNSNTFTLKDKKSNKVSIIHFPGQTKQLEAYDLFVRMYHTKHKWAAFIDIDEFIVLKKHNYILDFLNDYNNCNTVVLNWIMFGTSHLQDYSNEPVTKRFQLCSNKMDIHFKSICKLSSIQRYINPHRPLLRVGDIYDTNLNIIMDYSNERGSTNIACIHHYYTKSENEFRNKINRGRADIIEKRNLLELDHIHERNNDIHNSDAWDFYSKHI